MLLSDSHGSFSVPQCASRRRLSVKYEHNEISIEKQMRASVKDCFKNVKKKQNTRPIMQFISLYLKHKRSDVVFWLFQSEVAGEWFAVIDLIVNDPRTQISRTDNRFHSNMCCCLSKNRVT